MKRRNFIKALFGSIGGFFFAKKVEFPIEKGVVQVADSGGVLMPEEVVEGVLCGGMKWRKHIINVSQKDVELFAQREWTKDEILFVSIADEKKDV